MHFLFINYWRWYEHRQTEDVDNSRLDHPPVAWRPALHQHNGLQVEVHAAIAPNLKYFCPPGHGRDSPGYAAAFPGTGWSSSGRSGAAVWQCAWEGPLGGMSDTWSLCQGTGGRWSNNIVFVLWHDLKGTLCIIFILGYRRLTRPSTVSRRCRHPMMQISGVACFLWALFRILLLQKLLTLGPIGSVWWGPALWSWSVFHFLVSSKTFWTFISVFSIVMANIFQQPVFFHRTY